MKVATRTVGSATIVSLKGRLDVTSAPILEVKVATLVANGDNRIVLDCAGMSHVDISGLRALIVCDRHCEHRGGKMVVAALQRECRNVIDMSGLLTALEHHETSEAAAAALT